MGTLVARTLSTLAAIFLACLQANAGTWPARLDVNLNQTDGINSMIAKGLNAYGRLGYSVANVGDMNGDQIDDFAVSSPGFVSYSYASTSQVHVVFGSATGFPAEFDLTKIDGTNGFAITDQQPSIHLGITIAGAGDVNGDGLSDLVANRAWVDSALQQGFPGAFVIFGRNGAFPAAIDPLALNGTNGYFIKARTEHAFTNQVAGLGDIDGDGFDDLVVSILSGYFGYPGEAYIIYGKPAGYVPEITVTPSDPAGNTYLECSAAGHRVNCAKFAGTGDHNGDGFDDFAFGVEGASDIYVVFGNSSRLPAVITGADYSSLGVKYTGFEGMPNAAAAGDVNGDGLGDILAGTATGYANDKTVVIFGADSKTISNSEFNINGLDGANGFAISVNGKSPVYYPTSGLEDINGDGLDDISVTYFDERVMPNSEVAVIFGKRSGFPPVLDVGWLDGSNGFRIVFLGSQQVVVGSQSAAGDVNHDGLGDLLLGFPTLSTNGIEWNGAAVLLLGRISESGLVLVGGADNDVLVGGLLSDAIYGLSGNDSLQGKSGADMLYGGAGRDIASYEHTSEPVIADLEVPAKNSGDAFGDYYSSIEDITGSAFGDTLSGNNASNALLGGPGADHISGAGGDDTIVGGIGRDALKGGAGKDQFRFESLAESPAGTLRDVISDFNAGTSTTAVDRIDLRKIDANSGIAGNQAFAFIGTAPFSKRKGQLRVKTATAGAIVQGDVNGDGMADLEIGLSGFTAVARINAGDFRL